VAKTCEGAESCGFDRLGGQALRQKSMVEVNAAAKYRRCGYMSIFICVAYQKRTKLIKGGGGVQ